LIKNNKFLLGKRLNNPVKDYYFVHGARVLKSETIKKSIPRCSLFELGIELKNPTFRGIYEHIYDNNFDNSDFGTHYINFAYEFQISEDEKTLINNNIFIITIYKCLILFLMMMFQKSQIQKCILE